MKKAFTLIELLVVIAIIAIIAAIAFPVLAKATKRARRTECVANLRQIGCAISAYVSDWDEKYPWAFGSQAVIDSPANRPALAEVLQPYAKSEAIFHCPKDTGETSPRGPRGFRRTTPPLYKMSLFSYLWDGVLSGGPIIAGRQLADIKRPCEAYLSGKLRPWHGEFLPTEDYFKCAALYNVLYCDGHVEGKTAADWHYQEDHEFD